MTRTLKIALVLSVLGHLAFVLLRIEGEPLVESNLISLDVRLQRSDTHLDSSPEPVGATEPAAPAEALMEDLVPEVPAPLLAEEAEAPPADGERPAEATPAVEPTSAPVRQAEETAPEPPLERAARTAAGPQPAAIPERPLETATELRTIAPRPAPQPAAIPENTTEPAVRARIAFTDREQRMLERKVKEWSATFHRMDPTDPTVTWKHRGQAYTATFEQLAATDDRSIDELLVQISTDAEHGETLSTELRLKKLAFSNFAQFVDEWDPRVLMHDDEVEGRFHSNSEVHLSFNSTVGPVFHGKVTTSFRGINTENARGGRGRDEMFLGGLETGVRQISLPRELAPFPGDAGEHQLHFFAEDTRVTFYADGTFGRRPLDSAEPEIRVTIAEEDAYLIAGPKAALHVKGVVNGGVLVYSPSRIVIEDDLLYASDPDVDPDSDDYLGLVSDRFVTIANSDVTGPGDLIIHASVYAKRRFSVGRFRSRGEGEATLLIYGSLTAGSISATEPRYRTKIRFDPRLADVRAPSFPMTNRYEVAAWDGLWSMR